MTMTVDNEHFSIDDLSTEAAHPARYGAPAIALHWLVAITLAITIPLGMMLEHPPQGWGDTVYRLHWSFGILALCLGGLRLINRLGAPAPAPYAGLTPWEKTLSSLTHLALYALLIIVPVLGWAGKSAYGGAITVFGLFDLPALVAQNEAAAKTLLGLHKLAVKGLIFFAVLHVVGALFHAIVRRDGVMARMMPWRKA